MGNAELILLGIQIVNAVVAGVPNAIEARDAVKDMVAEGRDPTEAEWELIDSVTDGLRGRLHAGTKPA